MCVAFDSPFYLHFCLLFCPPCDRCILCRCFYLQMYQKGLGYLLDVVAVGGMALWSRESAPRISKSSPLSPTSQIYNYIRSQHRNKPTQKQEMKLLLLITVLVVCVSSTVSAGRLLRGRSLDHKPKKGVGRSRRRRKEKGEKQKETNTRNEMDTSSKVGCCRAMTAKCLACSAGIGVDKYCEKEENRKISGCDDGGKVTTTAPTSGGGKKDLSSTPTPTTPTTTQDPLKAALERTPPPLMSPVTTSTTKGALEDALAGKTPPPLRGPAESTTKDPLADLGTPEPLRGPAPVTCCRAMTADCLSCSEGQSIAGRSELSRVDRGRC